MDLAPIFYALLTLVLLVVILRLRKIAISKPKNAPRHHRSTYHTNV